MTDVYEFPDGRKYEASNLGEAKTLHNADLVTFQALTGHPSSGDVRVDSVDEVIQDAYDDALAFHNGKFTGLVGSCAKPLTWDENGVDGAATMAGAVGWTSSGASSGGGYYVRVQPKARPAERRGMSCTEFIAIVVVVLGLLGYMAFLAR
jgi:hypothetical protein